MALTLSNTINDMREVVNGLLIGVAAKPESLNGLSDVDLTGIQDGDVILYDASTQTFIPGTFEPARGANTEIQFNAAGVQSGSAALTFDYTSNTLASENVVFGSGSINDLTANTFSATSITETSARRYKENIVDVFYDMLPIIESLKPVTYNFKNSDKKEYGLIAEDVLSLLPELVKMNEDGEVEGIHYSKLTVILIKAIQELSERIISLESRL